MQTPGRVGVADRASRVPRPSPECARSLHGSSCDIFLYLWCPPSYFQDPLYAASSVLTDLPQIPPKRGCPRKRVEVR